MKVGQIDCHEMLPTGKTIRERFRLNITNQRAHRDIPVVFTVAHGNFAKAARIRSCGRKRVLKGRLTERQTSKKLLQWFTAKV